MLGLDALWRFPVDACGNVGITREVVMWRQSFRRIPAFVVVTALATLALAAPVRADNRSGPNSRSVWVVNGCRIEPKTSRPHANLTGAKLREANLSGANLPGADLSGAGLMYANLSGADIRFRQFVPRRPGFGQPEFSQPGPGEPE
jgi:hypothetical protein